jgi:outer membrane receptor protein involved in Fe transport
VRLSGSIGRDVTSFATRQAAMAQQVFSFENFIGALRLDVATAIAPWLRTNFGVDASGTSFGVNVTAPVPLGLGQYDRPLFDPQLVAIQSRVALGTPGIYGEAILDFAPLEISIGTRLDLLRYGTYSEVAPDPRTVVRLHASEDVTLSVSSGLFTQPPQVFQTISIAGNPRLGPQRSWQSSAQVEANLPWSIYARITGYFSYMWDIARLAPSNPGGTTARQFFSADEQGRSYGMEVLVRRPLADGFYGWLSYTLSRSERVDPGGSWYTFGFDQTHILNLAASYEFDGWRFGASFQVTTGRPTLSVCATTFDAESNTYAPTFCDRGARTATYTQLNIRIDRDFNIDNTLLGSIYLDVLNVYYAQNQEGLIYQYDYARSIPIPGMPILGTIGIRAYWEPH